MSPPPLLPALILQTSLLALLVLAALAGAWILRRARRRRQKNPLLGVRAGLRLLAEKAGAEGLPRRSRIVPGIWAHLSSSAPPSDESIEKTRDLARQEAGDEELAVFNLEDMIVSGHPMALTFYEIAGVDPEVLPPSGVSFVISPAILGRKLKETLESAGLEVAEESAGVLRAAAFGKELPVPLAGLFAEAAATATPIEIVARDEAYRLLAELSMRAGMSSGVPPKSLASKPHRDHCLHPPADDRSFGAWYFPVPERSGAIGAWVLVGHSIASISRCPRLLAGAAEALGMPRREKRLRAHSHRADVLVIADSNAETALLAACRKRARLFLGGIGEPERPPLLVDDIVESEGEAVGSFDLSPVDDRFFDAAAAAALARLHGDVTGAATARAMIRLSMNDLFGARAHLEVAAGLSPTNGEILLALGTLLNEIGDHLAAEPILRRAVGLDLENPATNNNLGVAYKGLGRLTEAQLFFEKAASIRPDDAVARVNLGRALLDSGDPNAAEHSFREALQRDPESVPALTGLVLVAVREGDYGLARLRLGTALGLAPTDAGLLRLHRALYPEEQAH